MDSGKSQGFPRRAEAPKFSADKVTKKNLTSPITAALDSSLAKLLWHGGLSTDGCFWLAPLLISPCEKISAAKYAATLRQIVESPPIIHALSECGFSDIEWADGVVSYPVLSKGVPLPTPEWLGDFLNTTQIPVRDRERIRDLALQAQSSPPQKGSFKVPLLRFRPQPSRPCAEALLDADRWQFKLTPPCRRILKAWLKFCDVLRDAEGAASWVLWSRAEIKQILSWDHFRLLDERTSPHSKKTWAAFIRSRAKSEQSIWSRAKDSSIRMDDLDLRDLYESYLPADFDDQAPRPRDLGAWCILPDISLARYSEFVREIWQASDQDLVLVEGDLEDGLGWTFAHDRLRSTFENWLKTVRDAAFKWAFETILEQAHSRQMYRDIRLTPAQVAETLRRRHHPNSLLQILWGHQEARSIDAPPSIIRQRLSPKDQGPTPLDQGLRVRLEPALMSPSCAATRPSSRLRRFPYLDQRYIGLSTWLKSKDDSSHLVTSLDGPKATKVPVRSKLKPVLDNPPPGDQISVPQIKGWQAAEFLWLMSANPGLFANTVVLDRGSIDVPEDHPQLLSLMSSERGQSGDLDITSHVTMRDAYDLMAWSTTMSPWPSLYPGAAQKLTSTQAPITIVDGGISGPLVKIAIRYESDAKAPTDQLLHSVQTLLLEAKSLPPGSPAQIAVEAELSKLWAAGGAQLTYTATPYFVVNELEISEAAWLGAKKAGKDSFVLPDGTLLSTDVYQAFTERLVARKRVLAKYLQVRLKDLWTIHREVTKGEAGALSPREFAAQLSMTVNSVLEQIEGRTLEEITYGWVKPQLGALGDRLRPYQLRGIAWMYQRLEIGLGVLLADEMGLGKTAQAIGLISLTRSDRAPALVVVPKSLVTNWQRELATFAPHLRVGVYPLCSLDGDLDVVLTTYARLRLHTKDLSKKNWRLVLLDEAQNIKNTDSQTTSAARSLSTSRRVALTGTPIENHAGELWSLLDWLNPGYLGSETDFTSYVRVVRASDEKDVALKPLRECLRPILLRRTKDASEVALSLPPKTFETLSASMSPEQALLYRTVLDVVLQEDKDLTSAFTRRAAYLKAILHLKQICNHPDVFYGDQTESDVLAALDSDEGRLSRKMRQVVRNQLRSATRRKSTIARDDLVGRSGKFAILSDLLTALKEQSKGILIFTQFRATAALLQNLLKTLGDPDWADVPFLHGGLSTDERQSLVDDFTRRSDYVIAQRQKGLMQVSPILILSLKAGGTGLNLTAADRVIHFDRWWNPAVEDQATDRAHRFGQDQPVFIYNLTTQGSIESSISKIFKEKKALSIDFLGGAAATEISEYLANNQGFLDLVDPDHIFQSRADGYAAKDLSDGGHP